MYSRSVAMLAVSAVALAFATPVAAQFPSIRSAKDAVGAINALGGLKKKKDEEGSAQSSGNQEPATNWDGSPRTPAAAPSKLTALPAEFKKPFPPLNDPELTAANIRSLVLRDWPGVAEIKKIAVEREPGALWTPRTNSDGSIASMWASILVHLYVKYKNGSCAVLMSSAILEKPSLGFGNGYGEIQVDQNHGPEHNNVSCSLT